jgi:hypothetical protein
MDSQLPFDVAVVVPTVLRPHLRWALESVYRQDLAGRIQVLVGIDTALGRRALLDDLLARAPAHVHVTVIDPGYSTSRRHGGVHSCHYGGSLRTALSYLANSRFVAYLDDDDWFAPQHLSSLLRAIDGHAWAWSQRWYGGWRRCRDGDGNRDRGREADGDRADCGAVAPQGWCVDEWESTGPDSGVYAERFGGFVAPSCLMLDKLRCHDILPAWSTAPFADGGGEDRAVFRLLRNSGLPAAATWQATSYCTLDPNDGAHALRLAWMRQAGAGADAGTIGGFDAGGGRLIGRPAG